MDSANQGFLIAQMLLGRAHESGLPKAYQKIMCMHISPWVKQEDGSWKQSCHITKEGKNNGFSDNSAGRKYTRKVGETIDMWHWKSVRTGLAFDLSHDQYIDSIADPEKNKNKESKLPIYMSSSDKNMPYIIESDKVPFVDTFKAGDEIAGIIVEKMTESAADVMTSNLYADGKWTLVFKVLF